MSHTLDCRGMPCPKPVLETKAALEAGHRRLRVLVDNEASCQNVARFARSQGCAVRIEQTEEACWALELEADAKRTPATGAFSPDDYSCSLPGKHLVYVIAADTMGRGDDQLGRSLLRTFIETIGSVEPLPRRILFYNSGVRLVTTGSPVLEHLRELQSRGVTILACGTCLEFYGLKAAIEVGQISNMHEILGSMTAADQVVSPW